MFNVRKHIYIYMCACACVCMCVCACVCVYSKVTCLLCRFGVRIQGAGAGVWPVLGLRDSEHQSETNQRQPLRWNVNIQRSGSLPHHSAGHNGHCVPARCQFCVCSPCAYILLFPLHGTNFCS